MNEAGHTPRVLIAEIGLDSHNQGAQVVAHGLREAGIEVIYAGILETPAAVARTAVQEGVDVMGISSMVGAHLSIIKTLMRELGLLNASGIPVILHGIIPEEECDSLEALGVSRIFPPDAEIKEIVQYIRSIVKVKDWVPEVPGSLTGRYPEEFHLAGSRCDRCGQVYFPSRKNCPSCLDDHPIRQAQLSDTGILQAFVVANVAPPGYSVPHAQGYIHLSDGGPLIFSLLTDYEEASNLKIGCEMALNVIKLGRDKADRIIVGYRFRPLKREK